MAKITWTKDAVSDLVRLREFLRDKNTKAAHNAVKKIKATITLLSKQPELGKPVEDMIDFRDISSPFGRHGYIVRYHYNGDEIFILKIRHMREEGF